MRAKGVSSSLERDLATRLKAVRDDLGRPDPSQLIRIRTKVLDKSRRRAFQRIVSITVVASTAILAAIAIPKGIAATGYLERPGARPVAEANESIWPDPWVAALNRVPSVEGDGWIPRHGLPNS
jgi:hypothetical protein